MRTKAIILKKQNTNEYDQLVTCYTEEFGKVTAVAKSVLKPSSIQAMHLDIFNLVDFELLNGRATPIITGAQAEKTYPNLKNNLACLAVGYFFAETADKLFFEYQKDEEIWNFLNSLVEKLDAEPVDMGEFLKSEQVEFFNILGYAPNLDECTFCSAQIDGHLTMYSIEARGGICQDCFLSGQRGIILKNGDWQSSIVLGSLFEGLVEKKLHSLSFIKAVL
ncbi:MAG: DNA repair protein RecO [bacterium]|nr:DNA repair protein RecO [bacterium]